MKALTVSSWFLSAGTTLITSALLNFRDFPILNSTSPVSASQDGFLFVSGQPKSHLLHRESMDLTGSLLLRFSDLRVIFLNFGFAQRISTEEKRALTSEYLIPISFLTSGYEESRSLFQFIPSQSARCSLASFSLRSTHVGNNKLPHHSHQLRQCNT